MHARFSALTALLALAAVHAVSGQTPPCTYSCPEKDTLGIELRDSSDTNGVLTCDYPPLPEEGKEANLGFSCQYSDTNGQLVGDKEMVNKALENFCPSNAVSSCDTAPPTQDPAPPANPPPTKRAPAPRALYEMKARAMLKKRMPAQVEDQA